MTKLISFFFPRHFSNEYDSEHPSSETLENRRMAELLLQENSRWFIILRWFVAGILPLLALVQQFLLSEMVIAPKVLWLSSLGLVFTNACFRYHHGRLVEKVPSQLLLNVWFQVLADYIVIAVLIFHVENVHNIAFLPLLFLPHIVLSGIMLGRGRSFLLVIISSMLYGGCLYFQYRGRLSLVGIGGIQIAGATALFATIWYMVAHLAEQIYGRDTRLSESHKEVRTTYESSRAQMYHTAHQMKSPVVAIQSLLELYKFEHEENLDVDVTEVLDKIDQRCEMLLTSVSEMLLLAKLKSGENVSWHFDAVAIDQLLKDIADRFKLEVEEKKLQFSVEVEPFSYVGDQDSLDKMFDNLISNAVHYTHAGGKVEIVGELKPDAYQVLVRDDGIGIKADQIDSIFDPHFRTIEAKRHCNLSTGLGLAIVKETASFHDVGVDVDSEEGVGSCFTLNFPLDRGNGILGWPIDEMR